MRCMDHVSCIDWLENYLKPDMRVFRSTARAVHALSGEAGAHVVSVNMTRHFTNGEGHSVPSAPLIIASECCTNTEPCVESSAPLPLSRIKYKGQCFESYVRAIDSYLPDQSLICPCGRQGRVACVSRHSPRSSQVVRSCWTTRIGRLTQRRGVLLAPAQHTDFQGLRPGIWKYHRPAFGPNPGPAAPAEKPGNCSGTMDASDAYPNCHSGRP